MLRFIYSRLAEWLAVVVGRILSFFLTNYSSSVDFWLALFAGSTVVGSAGAGGGGACWSDGVAVVRRRLLPPLVFAGSRSWFSRIIRRLHAPAVFEVIKIRGPDHF
ncbi:hypothetical protein BRADI_2g35015v3 [Brachypodium distachyon]|uniref:Uncharacterized protein n=1 Tax=Brachypodium distachyon TaxID=15368 RepID=A0A2K2DBV1_BRADI|nr:hypothetical protein BRADI_2g35015v3 [Brachypodium distachyon]